MDNTQSLSGYYWQPLFDHILQEHGVCLLESEMADIQEIIIKMQPPAQPALPAQMGPTCTGCTWVTGQYERLYDQLKAEPERKIVCWVNYEWRYRDERREILRDICAIRGKQMEFSSRGHGYVGVRALFDLENQKEEFISECEHLNVQWLDESGSKFTDLYSELEKIANYKHECGCFPCMGQCQSAESFKLDMEDLIEIAANALKKK